MLNQKNNKRMGFSWEDFLIMFCITNCCDFDRAEKSDIKRIEEKIDRLLEIRLKME